MKKIGVFVILLLLSLSIVSIAIADDNETESNSTTSEDTNSTTDDYETDSEKIAQGFSCLEEKVEDCSDLSIQEIALTIMATPDDDVFDDCVEELESRKSSNNWGSIRDTALAIMAMNHAGQDTSASEDWLLGKSRTPSDLVWYVEQDSYGEVECNVKYDSNDYTLTIGENKKIDKNAGTCLKRAQANFWLKVTSTTDCYDNTYYIECNEDFIATLLYKNRLSSTVYVLEGTESAVAYDTVELKVNSKCFGDSSCEYEDTVWATLALLETGHDIEEYIPYVVAMSDTNEEYLPDAFIYALTNYDDYANKLMEDQKLGDYWQAPSSAYDRFYDTALAILSTGSSAEKANNARDWLLFSQGSNGCWQNSIKDTAMVLWALEGRSGRTYSGSSVTRCTDAGYYCIAREDCPSDEDVGDNFFCQSTSTTCCINENLQPCADLSGTTCAEGLVCSGNEKKATDSDYCCLGTCVESSAIESECVSYGYSCESACSSSQEEVSYSCDGSSVCCKKKVDEGSSWWLWLIIILLLVGAGVFGYLKRDELKLWWFKMKAKFKKDKGGSGSKSSGMSPRPGMPLRPGFPPFRRMTPPPARGRGRPDLNDTFKKLREMSG